MKAARLSATRPTVSSILARSSSSIGTWMTFQVVRLVTSLLHIYDVEQVRHSDPHLKTDNLTSRADAALLSVADSRAGAGTRSWPGRAFSHRLSWRSSWALAPRWCRKARLIRRQLFWPDDGPLAVLPLKHHVPMPGLDPV